MKRSFHEFVEDLVRLGPLVAVCFAVVINLANFDHILRGELSVAGGAERFAVALAMGVLGIRALTQLLLRYGSQIESDDPSSSDDADSRKIASRALTASASTEHPSSR